MAYVTDRIMIYFCTCLNLMALKKAVSLFSSLLLVCRQKYSPCFIALGQHYLQAYFATFVL